MMTQGKGGFAARRGIALERTALGLSALGLAACATPGRAPSLSAVEAGRDWTTAPGASTAAVYARDLRRALIGRHIGDALNALRSAGYDCATGEAHEDHPDPMSVCTRSFATRACQLDWEAVLTMRRGVVHRVDGAFARDCVGTERDWPAPRRSAIDDQRAPPPTTR